MILCVMLLNKNTHPTALIFGSFVLQKKPIFPILKGQNDIAYLLFDLYPSLKLSKSLPIFHIDK